MAKKLTPEKLQELMQVADNQASSASANSEGTVDGNEVYLETLVYEINEHFAIDQKQTLENAWRAWLNHTGYDETDWEFDSFILQWKNNKSSPQGAWIEAWLAGVESVTGEKIN